MVKRLLILLCFLPFILNGQTRYYISPTGNDGTGAGTEASPWRTVFKASTEATTWGDVIDIKAGTYTESQRTVLEPGVSIEGENTATTIINYTYNTASYDNGAIYMVSSSITNGNQSISYVTITGSNYAASRGIYTRFRNNVEIHHCIIKKFDKSGINAYSTATNAYTLVGGQVTLTNPTTVFTTGLKINNCTIEDNTESPDNIGECNLRWSGYTGFEIRNNTFSSIVRVTPRNVYSDQVQNGTFHDNIINTRESVSVDEWLFAMEMYSGRGGCQIYGNTLLGGGTIDIAGYTILKGIYAYSWYIHDNTITLSSLVSYTGKPTVGITIECHSSLQGVLVTRNHIKNFPWGISVTIGRTGASIRDVYIWANVVENSASSSVAWTSFGIGVIQQSASVTKRNINIINNTITGNQTYSFRGVYISVDGTIDDIKVKNNIIEDFDIGIRVDNYSGTIDSLHLVNNLIHDCGTTVSLQSGITSTNYINTGELPDDPLFVSSTNFHLQDGSPAEQTGIFIGTPYLLDYDGTPFLIPPSRGAYETNSGFSTPTLTTTAISLITNTTASSGGVITSDGGASVTARGVCWNTSTGPTTANSKTTNGTGTGTFTSSITGLTAATDYYVRAYATNSAGTAYGDERVFQTNPDGGVKTIGLIKHLGRWVKINGKHTYK